jgi:hypothetical protein
MRRFLVSYQYTTSRGFGFGSMFHERQDDTLPGPSAIVSIRRDASSALEIARERVVILAISEVSPAGEVVI